MLLYGYMAQEQLKPFIATFSFCFISTHFVCFIILSSSKAMKEQEKWELYIKSITNASMFCKRVSLNEVSCEKEILHFGNAQSNIF